MGNLAERMIVKQMQEKSIIIKNQLQGKIDKGKMREASTSAMYFFHFGHIDSELFWRFIAYAYFICKTLGLLILISLLVFGRLNTILLILIFLSCYFLGLRLFKYSPWKKDQGEYL
jgi:hypothetical protein